MGFDWDPVDRLYRSATACIRARDGLFRWEWVEDGATRPVWVADRPLDHKQGIEIPLDVWQAGGTLNGLLFEPIDGRYTPHPFAELQEAVRRERYELSASRLRLRIRT
jgi:hypothetical protein